MTSRRTPHAPHPPRSSVWRAPLHPPLTDVPLGALVVVAVLDLFSATGLAAPVTSRTSYQAATYTLMIGTAVLIIAAVAGLADRARFAPPGHASRRATTMHAVTMSLVGLVCIADLIVRRNLTAAAIHTPWHVLVLTLVALALAVYGGAQGGKLTFREGVGVQPRSIRPEAAPTSVDPVSNDADR